MQKLKRKLVVRCVGVQIGKYLITPWSDTHIMIKNDDGCAGEFPILKLEKLIDKFYEKEF